MCTLKNLEVWDNIEKMCAEELIILIQTTHVYVLLKDSLDSQDICKHFIHKLFGECP